MNAMYDDPSPSRDESQEVLPARLIQRMAELNRAIEVPPEIDAKIRGDAAGYFLRQARMRRTLRWAGAAAAAAAAVIVLAIRLAPPPTVHKPIAAATRQREDIDGNGHIDILDAYTIARSLAKAAPTPAAWDVNGDGVVDQKDVDQIARMAVQVGDRSTQ
jgi:hypothetical protein